MPRWWSNSRATIASVEYGRQWPTRELAVRCDEILHSGGTLQRLWPLVDAERLAAREVLAGARLSDLRALVLHLAALTGADLSVLRVSGGDEALAQPAARRHTPTGGRPWAGVKHSAQTHDGAAPRVARYDADAAKGDEATP